MNNRKSLRLLLYWNNNMHLDEFVKDVARSMGFLGRIPLSSRFFNGFDGKMSRTARAFPLAGFFLALPAATVLFIMTQAGAAGLMSGLVAVAVMVLTTGALHEDGLADTADGVGGGRDREHSLTIMKDSRIGTYGAMALFFSLTLRAAALGAMAEKLSPTALAVTLIAAEVSSRALMVWHWNALPAARAGGVAASVGQPTDSSRNVALLSGALLSLILLVTGHFNMSAALSSLGMAAAVIYFFNGFIRNRLGGHTGDTAGATQQIASVVILCALATVA